MDYKQKNELLITPKEHVVRRLISIIYSTQDSETQNLEDHDSEDCYDKILNIMSNIVGGEIVRTRIPTQLDGRYYMDNFVEGECNRLAYSAGLEIASNPGETAFNPLLLIGEPGTGKTHLSTAIGHLTMENNHQKSVLYVTGEQLLNQYFEACRERSKVDIERYYNIFDLLIIDDIQIFAGKATKTQELVSRIIDNLLRTKVQLILTSEKDPSMLEWIEPRLLSRLRQGLLVKIQSPDENTLKRIISLKMEYFDLDTNDEVVNYIATHINNDIREVEGIVLSLFVQKSFKNKHVTLEMVKQTITHLAQ